MTTHGARLLARACALLVLALPFQVKAQDKSGCKDHPVFTRYPGSFIGYCEEQNHVAYAIARGPITDYRAIDDPDAHAGIANGVYHLALRHNEHTTTERLDLTR